MHTVNLPRPLVNKILTLAQAKEAQEICGFISRDQHDNFKVIPVKNIATDPARFFEMDPAETIQAMKTMRDQASELFAIYHSHPASPAFPSKTDIEQAGYPDALYLIISLNTKGVLELKAFKIQQDSVDTIDLAL